MPTSEYFAVEAACEGETYDPEVKRGSAARRVKMQTCMAKYGFNLRPNYDGGKRKTKSVKKTNKRRKNKRTSRKSVK